MNSKGVNMQMVERYGVFELKLPGKEEGNPFTDYEIWGRFTHELEEKNVRGFYNGNGEYIIRFMPSFTGNYHYTIEGSFSDFGTSGVFEAVENTGGNHGPVKVAYQYHFSYADGKAYIPIGTTCYAWSHQPLEMQEETLCSLRKSPFNKIRFCVFPKHYDYNLYEPLMYPYEGTPCSIEGISKYNFHEYKPSNPDNKWDYGKFHIEYFELLEKRVMDLQKMGIEADIILFHPYDRWGFSEMGREADRLYLQYVIARLSAYRNVWWSLANEYEFCKGKTMEDWEQIADVICNEDPYCHLRSIHNCFHIYDHSKPWITHCSLQRTEIYLSSVNTKKWREQYGKPVVLDEVGYEGNINHFWGNLTAEEMVRLFWIAAVRGGYCGHGETYMHPQDKLWWSHGNKLYVDSPKRIEFLKKIMEEVPGGYLEPIDIKSWNDNAATAAHHGFAKKYYLFYTDKCRPAFREFELSDQKKYSVDVIDTWDMTIENRGIYSGYFEVQLPSKPYMAIRIQEVG